MATSRAFLAWAVLVGFGCGIGRTSAGATLSPYLMKDLRPGPGSVAISDVAASSARGWFSSFKDLWRTNGTPGETEAVFSHSGLISQLTASGSDAFYVVEDSGTSYQVWRSDGTTAGTVTLIAFPWLNAPAPKISVGDGCVFVAVGGRLWHSGRTPGGAVLVHESNVSIGALDTFGTMAYFDDGGRLYSSDGTVAGTVMLKNLASATGPGTVTQIALSGPTVFFTVLRYLTPSGYSAELWTTDGTAAGTGLIKSFPDPVYSLGYLVAAQSENVFFVPQQPGGDELWRSDGTVAGTTLVYSAGGASLRHLVFTGGKLFFSRSGDLWRSDGMSEGTVLLRSSVGVQDSAGAGGLLFFRGFSGGEGYEPWRSDGTVAGTQPIADLAPGPGADSMPGGFTSYGSRVLFGASGGNGAGGGWVSDGTAEGTLLLTPMPPSGLGSDVGDFREVNGRTFFLTPGGGLSSGQLLWVTDGTEESTVLLKEAFNASGGVVACGNLAVTNLNDGLWVSDGTPAGTLAIDAYVSSPVAVGRRVVYLRQNYETMLPELRGTDGTAGGIQVLAAGPEAPRILGVISTPGGRRLLFFNSGDDGVYRLWSTDGTIGGTIPVADAGPGAIQRVHVLEDRVAWRTYDSASSRHRLWSSDGTTPGTMLLREVDSSGSLFELACRSRLYIGAKSPPGNVELSYSDPGMTGTQLVSTGLPYLPFEPYACSGHSILFTALGTWGPIPPIWFSDGTAAGTREVLETTTPLLWVSPIGDRFLFSRGDDAANGREVWVSDGTPNGTTLLKDIVPGPASSAPSPLLSAHGRLWFAANDGMHGRELWVTDGTALGTTLVADIAPGPLSGDPREMAQTASRLYFSAFQMETGREPWALPLSSSFYMLAPCRLTDSRESGTPLRSGEVRSIAAAGRCNVPPTARGLSVNLTVVVPSSAGSLSAATDPDAVPLAPTISFAPDRTRANNALLALDAAGRFSLFGAFPTGGTEVVVDVNAYFE